MSETSKLMKQLQDKAYREAFVFSQMSIPISFQVRALREHQGLTQKQLADKAGMLQPRIVELERPKGKEPNLRTLGRLAAAFDVALIVRFVPFSELVEWAEKFSPDTFRVPSFENDPGFDEKVAPAADPGSVKPSLRVTYSTAAHYQQERSPGESVVLEFPLRTPVIAQDDRRDTRLSIHEPLRKVS